jgi:hypothetical protein
MRDHGCNDVRHLDGYTLSVIDTAYNIGVFLTRPLWGDDPDRFRWDIKRWRLDHLSLG